MCNPRPLPEMGSFPGMEDVPGRQGRQGHPSTPGRAASLSLPSVRRREWFLFLMCFLKD